jgi:hypothetical protein
MSGHQRYDCSAILLGLFETALAGILLLRHR